MNVEAGQRAPQGPQTQQLEHAGFIKCANPVCDYWLSPEEQSDLGDGYFSCPVCKKTYNFMDPTPFGGNYGAEQKMGMDLKPQTFAGLSMKHQGDVAEALVQQQGTLGAYGKITWWSSDYNDPIDGGAGDWAIEVKAICIDAKNHRFVPGTTTRRGNMVKRAQELGFKGILGVLVILDYRRSLADIYAMEMPLQPWTTQGGRKVQGPVSYRKHNGQQLIAEVPFDNPFLDPNFHAAPMVPDPKAWAQDDIPF